MEPPRPPVDVPDCNANHPLLPDTVVPVLSNTLPDTPPDPALPVDTMTDPDPALILEPLTMLTILPTPAFPFPPYKFIAPPDVPVTVVTDPLDNVTLPPTFAFPVPTTMLSAPPRPPVAVPVNKYTGPELPDAVKPLLSHSDPESPMDAAFDVAITTEPDAPLKLLPLITLAAPPTYFTVPVLENASMVTLPWMTRPPPTPLSPAPVTKLMEPDRPPVAVPVISAM